MEQSHERKGEQGTMGHTWMDDAECKGATNLFFPPFGESKPKKLKREMAAKKICEVCVVRVECLAYARRNHEENGVWGGETEKERRKYLRSMRSKAS